MKLQLPAVLQQRQHVQVSGCKYQLTVTRSSGDCWGSLLLCSVTGCVNCFGLLLLLPSFIAVCGVLSVGRQSSRSHVPGSRYAEDISGKLYQVYQGGGKNNPGATQRFCFRI